MLVNLDADMKQALEAFISERDEAPVGRMTTTEAVNVIVRDWLTGQGYLAVPGEGDRVRTALDAAEVPRK